MLFLDGSLQSTTKDEVMYHTTLVHPLLDCLKDKSKILILGGGEGATSREVLRWTEVKSLRMVDYDAELVEIMVHRGDIWSKSSFNDMRLTCTYEDAWKYMASAPAYNGVIIDLTDPNLEKDNWLNLLNMVMASVKPLKGGFVMNAGLYIPWDTAKLTIIKSMVEEICSLNSGYKYYIYTTFIPSFNGEWTFFAVAHVSQFMKEPDQVFSIPEWIRRSTKVLPNHLIEMQANTNPDITRIS